MEKKTATETSAGGLIVSRYGTEWYILIMKDRGGNWTFPKGKIEAGESHEEAARREIAEEVGISGLTTLAVLPASRYWYFRKGSIRKTVHFFLFRAQRRNKPVVQKEEGISAAKWVKLSDAVRLVGYPDTNGPLLRETERVLTGIS